MVSDSVSEANEQPLCSSASISTAAAAAIATAAPPLSKVTAGRKPSSSRLHTVLHVRPTGEIQATFLALYLKFINTEVGQSCSEKSSGIHDKDYYIMIAYVLEV